MTQTDFARAIAALLRNNNIRKPVKIPQRTLHISDDDGNCKDITIKGLKKQAPYSIEDVRSAIISLLADENLARYSIRTE